MGRILLVLTAFAFVLTLGVTPAFAGTGGCSHQFSWFRDADGDGIPNGLDEDWIRPEDGTGYQLNNQFGLFVGGLSGRCCNPECKAQNQVRARKNRPETPGDCLRIRLRLKDGSCK